MRYAKTKAAPPFWPTRKGKPPQIANADGIPRQLQEIGSEIHRLPICSHCPHRNIWQFVVRLFIHRAASETWKYAENDGPWDNDGDERQDCSNRNHHVAERVLSGFEKTP